MSFMLQQERNYFKGFLNLLKQIAFHQLYMEHARKELCQDQNYDPHTAFKSMDHFKHNRIIAYELFSFFQLHRIQSTVGECEDVIKCLDKSLSYMDYESFEELTLFSDSKLRNLSKNRYSNVQIGVGSYEKLTFVKYHSAQVIALFLEKQLNFSRHFLSLKQEFCRKWGADVYTLLQKMFKDYRSKTKSSITFAEIYSFSREYGIIFNESQFRAIWRRSKNQRQTLQEMSGSITLTHQQLSSLVLVSNFNTKEKYGLQRNVPINKALQKPTPSYKVSHWRQHERWQKQYKERQLRELQELKDMKKYNMKYKFSCFESQLDNHGALTEFRNKNDEWRSQVERMDDRQLNEAYLRVTSKQPTLNLL